MKITDASLRSCYSSREPECRSDRAAVSLHLCTVVDSGQMEVFKAQEPAQHQSWQLEISLRNIA